MKEKLEKQLQVIKEKFDQKNKEAQELNNELVKLQGEHRIIEQLLKEENETGGIQETQSNS